MKQTTLRVAAALLAAGLAGTAWAAGPDATSGSSYGQSSSNSGTATKQDARSAIQNWSQASQNAANQMLQRYGNPDVASDQMLMWKDKAPFRKIVVMRDGIPHAFPTQHQDVLTEEINLQVPVDKVSDLARFDGSLIVDRTKGTVAARSDSEANNLLALNLANEIITGKRDVESARRFFADTAATSVSGKSSDYTSKLMFSPKSDTADPGQSMSPSGSSSQGSQGTQNPNSLPSTNQGPSTTPRQGY